MNNLINMLIAAETQNKEERRKTLKVASDYAKEKLNDDLLGYLLQFMAAQRIFPDIVNGKKKVQIKEAIPFDKNKFKEEFFAKLAKETPKTNDINALFKKELREAKKDHEKIHPQVNVIGVKLYHYRLYPSLIEDMYQSGTFLSTKYQSGTVNSWEKLLPILKDGIKYFYENFYLLKDKD